jgi:hypothetical protein
MREFKESDWKILRKVHAVAQERFCEQVLLEIERIEADGTKTFHQRYLAVYKAIQSRDKEIAKVFNDLRRSTAFGQLAAMKARGLLTE